MCTSPGNVQQLEIGKSHVHMSCNLHYPSQYFDENHPNARWVNYSIHLLNDTVTIHHSSISNQKMNHSRLLRKYHQFLRINFHNLYSSLTRWLTATDPFPPPSSTDDTTTIWRNSREYKIQHSTGHMFTVTMGGCTPQLSSGTIMHRAFDYIYSVDRYPTKTLMLNPRFNIPF